MAISSRAALAMSLGLLGVAGLVGVSSAQQQGDGAVRKTAAQAPAPTAPTAAPSTAAFKPAVVATIDLEAVLRNYEKAKFLVDQLKAESLAKQGQLKAVFSEAQAIAKEMESLQPGSKDFKDRGSKLTELKAKLEAGKQNLEGEDRMRYVEIMAGCYKEAAAMTERYARSRGISCVIKTSAEPIKTEDPDSVMAAMARPIMYSDGSLDITRSIVHNLNKEYVEAGGQVVKTPVGSATTDEATTPASAEKPAAAPATRPAAAPANRPVTKGQK